MKVLLHICCAQCLLAVLEPLQRMGCQLVGLFHNPNIHPFIEFRRRMKAVKVLAESLDFPIEYDESYPLDDFLRRVVGKGTTRCEVCYRIRLGESARRAREIGCRAFTSTLLVSPHQHHATLRRIGEELAGENGLEFLYGDWRHLSARAHAQAKRRQLYLQQYCGCIYSEYERFKDTGRHVYRGPGGGGSNASPSRHNQPD